jgi:hypothetical protein
MLNRCIAQQCRPCCMRTPTHTCLQVPDVQAAVAAAADQVAPVWVPRQAQRVALHPRQCTAEHSARLAAADPKQLHAAVCTRCCQLRAHELLGRVAAAAAAAAAVGCGWCCSEGPDGTSRGICRGDGLQLVDGQLQDLSAECGCKQAPGRVVLCAGPGQATDLAAVCARDGLRVMDKAKEGWRSGCSSLQEGDSAPQGTDRCCQSQAEERLPRNPLQKEGKQHRQANSPRGGCTQGHQTPPPCRPRTQQQTRSHRGRRPGR